MRDRFTLSNAHFSRFGRFVQDPCDVRMCCCNPEITVTTAFTRVTGLQKVYKPGCGASCCSKAEVIVAVMPGAPGSDEYQSAIRTFPDELDNVYATIADTWEKQKMIMAGVLRA
jgi:hypothetical protein